MKNKFQIILSSLALTIFLISCGGGTESWPTDLEGKRKFLTQKKSELKQVQEDIAKLNEEILELDPPKEKPPVLITTETVTPVLFERYTDVQASVMSDDMVFASSEMGGRLTSMTVKEGQYVNRGQLIATVDLQTINDQKAELETSMSLAKDVYDRQKRLWDQNIGTEIQFLQAKNNLERLQKSLDLLNNQIKKANVYAPISGVVDKEFLQAGEMSAPGAPIVALFNPRKLKVVADIPENYLGKIKRGDEVNINFPAVNKEIKKRVSLVGRTIDPSNRTFKVEIASDNLGGQLKPNLLAELSFNDYSEDDVVTVDLSLIQEEVSGKKYVYTVGKDGEKEVAQKSYISIGESSEGRVIITEGLSNGDRVIIEGARTVSPGNTVKELSK